MRDERMMVSDNDELLFMIDDGMWVAFDDFEEFEDVVELFYKGRCVSVLNGMDAEDFLCYKKTLV